MQESWIEVIGSSLIVRVVERQQATIRLRVSTKKTEEGNRLALQLRERTINALESVGIGIDDITDGGSSIGRSHWSSKKRFDHTLSIRSTDIEVLTRAMAAVGKVFEDAKTGMFSGIECGFTFEEDEPVYARTEDANEAALREAVINATGKAAILASQSGLVLGPVVSIREIERIPRRRITDYGSKVEDPLDFDAHLSVRIRGYDAGSVPMMYTRVTPRQTTGMLQLRVVFSVRPATPASPID